MSVSSEGRRAVQPPDQSPIHLGDAVIIGGGCYGTFYARQLQLAQERGKVLLHRVLVVDRNPKCQARHELGQSDVHRFIVADWSAFLDQYLGSLAAHQPIHPSGHCSEDVIVPSPLMPHLMYQWLLRRALTRWPGRLIETRRLSRTPGTPYDTSAPDSTRYISFADWLCPTHCIEPTICPIIRAPRTWEMSELLQSLARRLGQDHPTVGPVLFVCRHRAFGVGDFAVPAVLAGDAAVAEAGSPGEPVDVLVGTVSACHGAVNILHLGPG